MQLLPEKSPDRIVRQLHAERLRRIFWQGEHPLGGPRSDVCPIVAEYYETEAINNLKGTKLCYLQKAKKLSTILADLPGLLKAEVIIPILYLLKSNQQKLPSYRDESRYI